MSSVAEIESAIERLPALEKVRLRDWLLERVTGKPKTGSELALLWRSRFHLSLPEAEDLDRDMKASRQTVSPAPTWE